MNASAARLRAVYAFELAADIRRPLPWICVLVVGFLAFGLAGGHVTISAGDESVGGHRAWITSEFANAHVYSLTIFLFYSFFLAVLAGMTVIRDEELRVSELLHATRLRPAEYVWGKFAAVMTVFAGVLALNVLFSAVFNHLLPNAEGEKIRGPFHLLSYLRPAMAFGLPTLVFIGGMSFLVGVKSKRPILVFALPVAALLLCGFFLWSWSPGWLDPRVNRLFMWLDPAGYRWLMETWLKVDRGVAFYNVQRVGFDAAFVVSRLVYLGLGIGAVAWAARHLEATLRGAAPARNRRAAVIPHAADARGAEITAAVVPAGLMPAMVTRIPGRFATAREVARVELAELRNQPGLYIFVPLILLQVIGTGLTQVGWLGTSILVTPGISAVRTVNTITLLVTLLLLFYTVESLLRERHTGLAPISHASPARDSAILIGKSAATAVVAMAILAATLLASGIAIAVQHRVRFDLRPFLIVWGLLLVPTFLLWNAFVMMLLSIVRNRYTTYAIGFAALGVTGWLQARKKMTWAGNWNLWDALQWSDMGTFEMNRAALVMNRLFVLSLALLFVVIAIRFFPRREGDSLLTGTRLTGGTLRRQLRLPALFVIPSLALGIALGVMVDHGFQGRTARRHLKDYWKQNLATWKDAPRPAIVHVDLDADFDPAKHGFRVEGSYLLRSGLDHPLRRFAITTGPHWRDVAWTVNGAEASPENRSGLYVFMPEAPMAPGDTLRLGFRYRGVLPRGITRNGGGAEEFVLPSGIVLTSFTPSFAPLMGFSEEMGVEDENRYEPKEYPDDFYEGNTPAAFGEDEPFTTRITLHAPAEYTLNSVGTCESDRVLAGRRTTIWVSDHPVRFFNVVGGRWAVRDGEGTRIFYHAAHRYNLAEMGEAIDGARRYYAEWFLPFPWRELKLSEFPGLAGYAQGFPTDISFSEAIGFLARSTPKSPAAFIVTAHESAHQWWGNILTPGKGPGGNILSEGMSHFSTMLLLEQLKGPRYRIEFARRIEEDYGNERRADAERKLVLVDGSKAGDRVVIYDKGGWVFWMLLQHMGRERALAGCHDFIARWSTSRDHAVLQDFTREMRAFAPDTTAYDDFVRQWFFDVVVPQYRLTGARKVKSAGGAGWEVTATVENIGTGTMPIEIAASRGDRWEEKGGYEEARTTVTPGAGASAEIRIPTSFEPELLVVDPDARVLQLERKAAMARL